MRTKLLRAMAVEDRRRERDEKREERRRRRRHRRLERQDAISTAVPDCQVRDDPGAVQR
jgi:hypothetical protein